MSKDITNRIIYLAEMFDVFEIEGDTSIDDKLTELGKDDYDSSLILNKDDDVLGILSIKVNNKNRELKKISINSSVFADVLAADPTVNKIYSQWILNIFSQFIKENTEKSIEDGIRLIDEDLPQSNLYLTLFEEHKRKAKFKELCKSSYSLINIVDPTNINQYKSLSQLFDSVDPFIEKDPTVIERTMMKYVNTGKAEMPVKDRNYTLFIPKTRDASVIFGKFASWCTSSQGNGMFKKYTEEHKKPNGVKSDIYIIIENDFFLGKSDNLFQIHFESGQIRDRKNNQDISGFETVLKRSEGIKNFFNSELLGMAKHFKKGLANNRYFKYLLSFGFTDNVFDLLDTNTSIITFMSGIKIKKMPDVSKFTSVDQMILTGVEMVEIDPSIGKLVDLRILALTNNKIKDLPNEIGNLKNLRLMNLIGNPIREIPDSIRFLDKSNGGSLIKMCINKEDIGFKNYEKLKELLPTTIVG